MVTSLSSEILSFHSHLQSQHSLTLSEILSAFSTYRPVFESATLREQTKLHLEDSMREWLNPTIAKAVLMEAMLKSMTQFPLAPSLTRSLRPCRKSRFPHVNLDGWIWSEQVLDSPATRHLLDRSLSC